MRQYRDSRSPKLLMELVIWVKHFPRGLGFLSLGRQYTRRLKSDLAAMLISLPFEMEISRA